jgi:hypothetical protein
MVKPKKKSISILVSTQKSMMNFICTLGPQGAKYLYYISLRFYDLATWREIHFLRNSTAQFLFLKIIIFARKY